METTTDQELEVVLKRLQEVPFVNSDVQPARRPTSTEIDAKLRERGYPERHRLNLANMRGPGLEKALALLPRVISRDALLTLIGDHGPGKTQIATWWAAKRLEAGNGAGLYTKTADLIGEIKATWSDGGKSIGTENDILKKYRSAKYLVLDEFHERGASEWEARTINNILDHRYDSMLVTVIIANLSEADFQTQISPSIRSRAEETGGLIVCDWPSYRKSV